MEQARASPLEISRYAFFFGKDIQYILRAVILLLCYKPWLVNYNFSSNSAICDSILVEMVIKSFIITGKAQ